MKSEVKMFSNLFQTICRIGIFMICAQAIVHFRPEGAYEKYLKLLVGSMILIQLFLPVGRLLFRGDGHELALKSEEFMKELEAEMAAAEISALETEALLEQMTLEEVRRRMEEAGALEENGEVNPEESLNISESGMSESGEPNLGELEDSEAAVIEIDPVEKIRVEIQESTYDQ